MLDKSFGNIFIFCFLCINYWFEIDIYSIQAFEIKSVTTWLVFLVTLGVRCVSGNLGCKICLDLVDKSSLVK